MATSSHPQRVRVPPGSRDWFLPLADARARTLRNADIGIVGISEVVRGFDWAGPGTTHLVLGTIKGNGFVEVDNQRFLAQESDLIVCPAGMPRRFATRSAGWKFLAIRLVDGDRWRHLVERGVRPLPSHWLRRLVAPVEGMLAEHPLGNAMPAHTQRSQRGSDESPGQYLFSRYADRVAPSDADSDQSSARADAFELHATILRHQIEGMLTIHPDEERDDDAVALASLWNRVADRPRGPWDAEDLAAAVGVSRTSLYRMVKRHHETSPARLVERLRMDEACRLLLESRHSIEVIADQVGYASAFSFSAAFKRFVGESPSRFRLEAADR
ncbi:MAG: helix-turn-helix transcriptional regulator [bacterium]|nr:helix-turn-helix transcriptional regulator [bacterium]